MPRTRRVLDLYRNLAESGRGQTKKPSPARGSRCYFTKYQFSGLRSSAGFCRRTPVRLLDGPRCAALLTLGSCGGVAARYLRGERALVIRVDRAPSRRALPDCPRKIRVHEAIVNAALCARVQRLHCPQRGLERTSRIVVRGEIIGDYISHHYPSQRERLAWSLDWIDEEVVGVDAEHGRVAVGGGPG